MTIKDIMSHTPRDFNRMNTEQLREYLRAATKAANQRRRRLEKSGLSELSTAYQNTIHGKRGSGTFTTRGKDTRGQLYSELIRTYNFLNSTTSTVRGTRKVFNTFKETLQANKGILERTQGKKTRKHKDFKGYDPLDVTGGGYAALWRIVDKWRELNPHMVNAFGLKSGTVKAIAEDTIATTNSRDINYIYAKVKKNLQAEYERRIQEDREEEARYRVKV